MKYTIKLLSDWHVGSGLSAGAESDAEVLKDENDLPYIPGKTIKGLLKDALNEMATVEQVSQKDIDALFGWEIDKASTEKHNGKLFFSNASLCEKEQEEIHPQLANFLYRNITQTKINTKGVAENQSLRTMEVCRPLELTGEIMFFDKEQSRDLDDSEKELIEKALKWVRHLGVNRNRGLGRCQFLTDKSNTND